MTIRGRTLAIAAALALMLALPGVAWAHAALLRTVPDVSSVVNTPPAEVDMTYSEPVEPKFAIVSVTDAGGHLVTSGSPHRSPTNPDTLVVPLKHLPEGWYLVYWRVISVDGHPVRGAFEFAVGPNPGPQPQFVIPSISETAATPQLLIFRFLVFLTYMAAVGLFCLRILIARPLVERVRGTSLRAVSIAFFAVSALALVLLPVYVDVATAKFTLRSAFSVGTLVPFMRSSAFGRGYLDLELCFGLFVVAAAIALWLDRPERGRRSIAAMLSLTGALVAGTLTLGIPGVAGHAGQTSPRGAAILFDWVHVAAAALWVGGLIGLLVLWRSVPSPRRVAALVICVPRFSNVAFVSVLALVSFGIGSSLLHFPTLASLWQTSYGLALVAKIGLLGVALLLAAVNLLRTKPRLAAARERPDLALGASTLLRRLVTGEVLIVAGALFAAAILTSLAPPAKALATIGKAKAHVGPGPANTTVKEGAYSVQVRVDPNRAAQANDFSVRVTRGGQPVQKADVTATFAMLDMEMGQQAYHLPETGPGVYSKSAPALVMVGHWGVSFEVQPPGQPPFSVLVVDKAAG
jgi:copper transport protein